MTTGKTIALTRWTFVGKVMSLLFNILSWRVCYLVKGLEDIHRARELLRWHRRQGCLMGSKESSP